MIRRVFGRVRSWWTGERIVGRDHLGNNYYEEPGAHAGRSRRTVVVSRDPKHRIAEHADPQFYYQNELPAQWRAWLSHTRYDPPTMEEVVRDQQLRQMIRQRAIELEEKWKQRKEELLQTEEYQLLLQKDSQSDRGATRKNIVDFEALLAGSVNTKLPAPEKSSIPSGQGETFLPGEWQPVSKR